MSLDELKRAFSPIFTRDIRTVEPSKKGLIVGENLRVYQEASGWTLSFLRGTDNNQRKSVTDKLDVQGISYKVGDDFEI